MLLTETWLKSKDIDSVVLGTNNSMFRMIRCDRLRKRGGGVAIVLSILFCFEHVFKESIVDSYELLCGDVYFEHEKLRLLVVYRSPTCSLDQSRFLAQKIADLVTCGHSSIVAGDFNLPDILWNDNRRCSNVVSREYVDMFTACNLSQYVMEPTRGESVLDLLLCNSDGLIKNVVVSPEIGSSDHMVTSFDLCIDYQPAVQISRYNFAKGDYDAMKIYLSSIDWLGSFQTQNSVDDVYEMFIFILRHCIFMFVPFEKVSSDCSKLPSYLANMAKHRHSLWSKARSSNDQGDWLAYKRYSEKFIRRVNKFSRSIEKKIIDSGSRNAFYSYILRRSGKMSSNKVCSLKDQNNVMIHDNTIKANLLADVFESVFTEDNGNMPNFAFPIVHDQALPLFSFYENIVRSIKSWSISYSRTPDDIPMAMIKKIACEIGRPLEYIFNLSLMTSVVPKKWKHSFVIPLPKKEPLSDPSNYRPVSLTSFFCRVFEKFMLEQINEHIRLNEILSPDQHGFRRDRSTETQMLEALDDWTLALDAHKSVDVMYLDFAKAFDRVSHVKLVEKLRILKFNRVIVNWIENFLADRTFEVRLCEFSSTIRRVSSGVPQGSVLSPTLFNLFTCEVPNLFINSPIQCKVYADDTKLYQAFSDTDTNVMQEALNKVIVWSVDWQLPLSAAKTQILHIGNQNPRSIYYVDDVELEPVDEDSQLRDLGFMISSDLNFKHHAKKISDKARKMIYCIFKILSTKNANILINSYKTFIRPIVESGTTVFNSLRKMDSLLIEKVQNEFTRRVFRRTSGSVRRKIPNSERRNRMYNLQSLDRRRLINDLVMMYKLYKGNSWRELKDFFDVIRTDTLRRKIRLRWPKVSLDVRRRSFVVRGGILFTKFYDCFLSARNLKQFKSGVSSLL